MSDIRTTVRQVLNQLANSREARYYLSQYNKEDRMEFAVVKVGGAIIEEQLDQLAAALAFLRNLGLMPIISHGAGPQLDKAITEAGIPTEKHNGLRVTTPEVMAIARPVIYRANRAIVGALENQGVRAEGIIHGVFECDYLDKDKLGLVGEIKGIDLEAIREAIEDGMLPVVACLGESAAGQVMNINADIAARELIWAIKPQKIIFLTGTGGLLDESGRVISSISLKTDFDYLVSQPWVHGGMQLKLEQIAQILNKLPDTASVSITSVENLAKELFTHRGAGTLIRKGEKILELDDFDDTNRHLAVALLEQSFSRKLKPGYLEDLPFDFVLVSESFGSMAILAKGVDGIPYLDKFAVTPEAQGAGLGSAVWQSVVQRCPQLYWRSRVGNPVTQWYYEQADFSFTQNGWVAFSRGIKESEQIWRCKEDALARQDSFIIEESGQVPA